MEEIRSLSETSFDDLYSTWSDAFSGYEKSWTKAELQNDLRRRGYAPELSFGLFDKSRIISFVLNGIGGYNGKRTAYDTGTGTIKEYQGRGLAKKLLRSSLQSLAEAGLEQYILEVLQKNSSAISLYSALGFKISRDLNYYFQDANDVAGYSKALPEQFSIRPIELTHEEDMRRMWDYPPSWQNGFESIRRKLALFTILGAFDNGKLVGYGIIDPATGDIPQLAVAASCRRKGIGGKLLAGLLSHNKHSSVRFINADWRGDALASFIQSMGIPLRGAQHEMVYIF